MQLFFMFFIWVVGIIISYPYYPYYPYTSPLLHKKIPDRNIAIGQMIFTLKPKWYISPLELELQLVHDSTANLES